MKVKRKKVEQFISFDCGDDEEKVFEHLDECLYFVGCISMYFNGLEKRLDHFLCLIFSDRTDEPGLIVLQNMQFAAKVNLFGRFSDSLHKTFGEIPKSYNKLMDRLRESGQQRNMVVHADWENTDNDGFTHTRVQFSDEEMHQEYRQFSTTQLESVLGFIMDTRHQLADYWDEREMMLEKRLEPTPSTSDKIATNPLDFSCTQLLLQCRALYTAPLRSRLPALKTRHCLSHQFWMCELSLQSSV